MSLYDKASLILPVSPAYKDGALQSYKPLTSEGTFAFSRGSNLAATRVDVNGLIVKGRENLLLQSNQFDTTWGGDPSNRSITSGFSGYDGTNDAWKLEAISDNNYSVVSQAISNAGVETFSVYAKAGTSNFFRIHITGGTNTSASFFDLSGSGAVGNNFNEIDAKIESIGNGWFRCSVTANKTTSSTCVIMVVDANSSTTVTTGSNIYIQDAQIEQGLVATDYIETGATTAQAGILEDLPRLDYSGGATCPSLSLEPSRTNIIESSEYLNHVSWATSNMIRDANSAISPEGVQNAYKIIPTTASGVHILSNGTLGTATYSMFAKQAGYKRFRFNTGSSSQGYASFDLNTGEVAGFGGVSYEDSGIEDFGNGWYRCYLVLDGSTGSTMSIAVEDNNGSVSFAGDGTSGIYIYGAQCEASASYPTSYIPTYGTSVTRAADFMNQQISGLTSITQGTFLLDFDRGLTNATTRDGNTDGFFYRSGNSFPATNAIEIATVADGKVRVAIRINGFSQLYANDTLNHYKILIKWSGTSVNVFVNGVSEYTSTTRWTATLPLQYIGYNASFRKSVNQVLTFPTALTDAECIALTTI